MVVPESYLPHIPPGRFVVTVRLAAPGLAAACDIADVTALLRDAGAPMMRLADARMSSDDTLVECDIVTSWSDPDDARRRVVNAVRERASMDARFARWIVDAHAVRPTEARGGTRPART